MILLAESIIFCLIFTIIAGGNWRNERI